jgi:hypothetical protein
VLGSGTGAYDIVALTNPYGEPGAPPELSTPLWIAVKDSIPSDNKEALKRLSILNENDPSASELNNPPSALVAVTELVDDPKPMSPK